MNWIDYNLNYGIRFKLTVYGMQVMADQYNEFVGKIRPSEPKMTADHYRRIQEEKGYTEMQLWCFMEELGPHIGMCKPLVVEMNTIQFKLPEQK